MDEKSADEPLPGWERARRPLLEDETGLSTTEYILVLILISVVGIIAWQLFGESVADKTEEAEAELRDMGTQSGASIASGSGGGMGGTMGGGGRNSPDGVEQVGEADPSDPGSGGGGEGSGEGTDAPMGGGGEGVEAQGVVNRQEGDMPVYTAPSEDESDNSVLITIAIVVFLMFGAIGLLAKVRGKA